jgi:non-specific serine/threonine protein kinase
MARQLPDHDLLAYVLNGAGMIYSADGDLDAAMQMCNEAASLLEGSSNLRLAMGVKNSLGLLAVQRGDYAGALDHLVACVAHSRSEGNKARTAQYLESLANAQLGLGDVRGASAGWTESLSIFRDLNDPYGTIWSLGGLALVAAANGDQQRTLRLASAADRMSREWSLSTRTRQLEEASRQARASLGDRRSEEAWNDGQAMTADRALEYALGEGKVEAEPAVAAGPLSRREREVVAMVAAGMTNRQIAGRLFIAERTAEGHVERIRNKLGFRSRTEVATWAVQHGIGSRHLDKNPPGSSV